MAVAILLKIVIQNFRFPVQKVAAHINEYVMLEEILILERGNELMGCL